MHLGAMPIGSNVAGSTIRIETGGELVPGPSKSAIHEDATSFLPGEGVKLRHVWHANRL
jgi:hypothetical protein